MDNTHSQILGDRGGEGKQGSGRRRRRERERIVNNVGVFLLMTNRLGTHTHGGPED